MHHELANQEIARIRYAQVIRDSARQHAVDADEQDESAPRSVLRWRLAGLFQRRVWHGAPVRHASR
jgi:hypothetical protein